MSKFYVMNKKDDEASISIFGQIGDSWWEDGVTAKQFKKDLDALGSPKVLNIDINSPGGSFFEGLAIYNMLKNHSATKNVTILGLAASAASTLAMAGDTVRMSEDAYIMIHNSQMWVRGDKREMQKSIDVMVQFDATIANIYAKKTGKEEKELFDMMDAETWMNGKDAKEHGFVDEVTDAKNVAACFNFTNFRNTPISLKRNDNLELYSNQIELIKRRLAT